MATGRARALCICLRWNIRTAINKMFSPSIVLEKLSRQLQSPLSRSSGTVIRVYRKISKSSNLAVKKVEDR